MTNVPVPWPWPFSKKRINLLPKGTRITTDSFAENFLIRPLILVLLVVALIFNVGIPIIEQATGAEPGAVSKVIKEDLSANKKAEQKKRAEEKKAKKKKAKEKQAKKNRRQAKKRQAEKRQAKKRQAEKKSARKKPQGYHPTPNNPHDNPLKGLESSR